MYTMASSRKSHLQYPLKLGGEFLGMLKDPINLLYFHFVSPIVTEFERVNSLFQTTDADTEELNHSAEEVGKVDEVKRLCAGLVIEALKQVESRLPASTGISKGLSAFAPRKVLSQTERVPFKDLSLPHLRSEKEDTSFFLG
ncbi:putative baculoviral IAP repeat-containing protein 6-like 2 [Homarus americanus]|uniref:Putative baculoviral IAP repeat-containing protein 6-like 2 n=1 Tax=Homarus americanus TaxID=6706 RepID=A0A8J5JBI4_HOMAM|nr:putative baculoviral IAP repeat-containing protein 6-like 2 [Homarus americanus]